MKGFGEQPQNSPTNYVSSTEGKAPTLQLVRKLTNGRNKPGACGAQAGLIAPELASGQDPWWGLVSPLSPFPKKKSHRTPWAVGKPESGWVRSLYATVLFPE